MNKENNNKIKEDGIRNIKNISYFHYAFFYLVNLYC